MHQIDTIIDFVWCFLSSFLRISFLLERTILPWLPFQFVSPSSWLYLPHVPSTQNFASHTDHVVFRKCCTGQVWWTPPKHPVTKSNTFLWNCFWYSLLPWYNIYWIIRCLTIISSVIHNTLFMIFNFHVHQNSATEFLQYSFWRKFIFGFQCFCLQ